MNGVTKSLRDLLAKGTEHMDGRFTVSSGHSVCVAQYGTAVVFADTCYRERADLIAATMNALPALLDVVEAVDEAITHDGRVILAKCQAVADALARLASVPHAR